jgi:hypothetical protein
LLLEAIGSTGEFVRSAKTQEVEGNNAPPASDQIGDQIVPDVQIIGEAVHEHEGGTGACIVASIDFAFFPRDKMLGKLYMTERHI